MPNELGLVGLSGQEAVIRYENETMMAMARQKPRSQATVRQDVEAELDMYPEDAQLQWYAIPYKTQGGGQTIVEGPSIKAAMVLARHWGNCAVTCRLTEETETGFVFSGIFTDYETGFRVERPLRVEKVYRKTGIDPVFQAGASKAIRNAILAALPQPLINSYMRKAKALAAVGQSADKAIAYFKKEFKITEKGMVQHLGKAAKDWSGDDLSYLRGIMNALKDGQMTVQDFMSTTIQEDTGASIESALDVQIDAKPLPSGFMEVQNPYD